MTGQTVLRGALCVLPSGAQVADIAIFDGVITAIGKLGCLSGNEVIDLDGLVLMPGAVDMHVHFRDPGFSHKEDFAHGTAAAACGGVTTVIDMPNTDPPVTTPARLKEKIAHVAEQAHVDYGFWAGGRRTGDFAAMAEAGAIGLKIYMVASAREDDPYTGALSVEDDATLLACLRRSAEIGWTVSVHVDNPALARVRREELQALGRRDVMAYHESLGGTPSLEAIRRLILLAKEAGTRLHIAHISLTSPACVEEVRQARQAGQDVTAESLPPLLSLHEAERLGPIAIPHIWDSSEQRAYMSAIIDGTIDSVATDHAPHRLAEKLRGREDIWLTPPGYPGIETSLPLMLDVALAGEMTLERLAEVMATAPARRLGLPTKGAILPGMDADLVVIDPSGSWIIDEQNLHSKAGWSPFHGRRLQGRLVRTMLRGTVVAEDGELVKGQSIGRMVTRSSAFTT